MHRRRYQDHEGKPGDWVLPKGKVESGETLEAAALREVEEETGCRARIVGPSFFCEYLVQGVPKLVIFFRMECESEGGLKDTAEVQAVYWLTPDEAFSKLTYETERHLLAQAYPDQERGPRHEDAKPDDYS